MTRVQTIICKTSLAVIDAVRGVENLYLKRIFLQTFIFYRIIEWIHATTPSDTKKEMDIF